uniref:Uncharacterized protein n=1 Tax=Siphoviridae sp. ctnpt50 TaxID=2827941 RepID=A0A8S5SDU4_9CAUD|nr:MAG TPA: hypothetical protein [Siphoviridae sp. ctnpt50]
MFSFLITLELILRLIFFAIYLIEKFKLFSGRLLPCETLSTETDKIVL